MTLDLDSHTGWPDDLRIAADRYAEANEPLLKQLVHHLDEEEDLIIPLILDRGEGPLGIG